MRVWKSIAVAAGSLGIALTVTTGGAASAAQHTDATSVTTTCQGFPAVANLNQVEFLGSYSCSDIGDKDVQLLAYIDGKFVTKTNKICGGVEGNAANVCEGTPIWLNKSPGVHEYCTIVHAQYLNGPIDETKACGRF
ncbi:hypothetical protein [Sciscionella sediminilitoris]|uniref:hypothetical protein n=1 Tax=Sciscionella sediminilitoris TaxID=1445613 RepID=UPI0004DFC548|nr:hypothetical protein [Sciscionella sp. SE31]